MPLFHKHKYMVYYTMFKVKVPINSIPLGRCPSAGDLLVLGYIFCVSLLVGSCHSVFQNLYY